VRFGLRVSTISLLIFVGGLVLVGWHLADPDHCPHEAVLCDPPRCRRAVDPAPQWQCPIGRAERMLHDIGDQLETVLP